MNIDEMLDVMCRPEPPALEVITLDRAAVEEALNELEASNPYRKLVVELRAALAEPKPELWVTFTPGPNETFAFASKEDAEQEATALLAMGREMKAGMIARGESVEFWQDWKALVVPSPWTPEEHWKVLAMEQQDQLTGLRADMAEYRAKVETYEVQAIELAQQTKTYMQEAEQQIADLKQQLLEANARNADVSKFVGIVDDCYHLASSYSGCLDGVDEHGGDDHEDPICAVYHRLYYAMFLVRPILDAAKAAAAAPAVGES